MQGVRAHTTRPLGQRSGHLDHLTRDAAPEQAPRWTNSRKHVGSATCVFLKSTSADYKTLACCSPNRSCRGTLRIPTDMPWQSQGQQAATPVPALKDNWDDFVVDAPTIYFHRSGDKWVVTVPLVPVGLVAHGHGLLQSFFDERGNVADGILSPFPASAVCWQLRVRLAGIRVLVRVVAAHAHRSCARSSNCQSDYGTIGYDQATSMLSRPGEIVRRVQRRLGNPPDRGHHAGNLSVR